MRSKGKFFFIIKMIALGSLMASQLGESAPSKPLQISTLRNRVYRLETGAVNRCPEKVGIRMNTQATELLLYPMEIEWERPRTHVSPLVIVRGIRRSWEAPREEVVRVGKTENTYSAELDDDTIEAVTRSRIEDGMTIASHAKLEFSEGGLNLTRWSESEGLPLSENLLCVYKDSHQKVATSLTAINRAE